MKSLDRNQFIAIKLGKLNNETILDIGCRDKVFKNCLEGDYNYLGVDYDPNDKNADYINHNLETGLPKNLGQINIINAADVLEHVENDKQCMKELYRVLKPGGWGIFQVPIDWNRKETYEDKSITSLEDREKHYWQKDHVRLYGLDYPNKLSDVVNTMPIS